MVSESAAVLPSDSSLVPELLFPLSAPPLRILKEGLLLLGKGEPDSVAEAGEESSLFELCGVS